MTWQTFNPRFNDERHLRAIMQTRLRVAVPQGNVNLHGIAGLILQWYVPAPCPEGRDEPIGVVPVLFSVN